MVTDPIKSKLQKSNRLTIRRVIQLDEVEYRDHTVKWRVAVADFGRAPFMVKYFSTPEAAEYFYKEILSEEAVVGVE